MRIVLFSIVALIALFLPVWAFGIAALMYALFYTPYEILILALCIDAQFGDPHQGFWFIYTTMSACILLSSIFIKPQLRFYC
jgi:hypothetical protein